MTPLVSISRGVTNAKAENMNLEFERPTRCSRLLPFPRPNSWLADDRLAPLKQAFRSSRGARDGSFTFLPTMCGSEQCVLVERGTNALTKHGSYRKEIKMSNCKRGAATSWSWFMVLLLAAFVAGCGSGGGVVASAGPAAAGATAVPGAAGAAGAAATDPTVGSASPSNGASNVPTSTNAAGNVASGTLLTATFTQPMNPATIISPLLTFTLKETASGNDVPGTVAMNAAHTIATFAPTAAALTPNISYTASVSTAAKNAGGTAMPNPVAWSFTTNKVASTGQTAPDLGTAGTYGVFASDAAVTLAANAVVNGDVGLNPAAACNNCVIGTTIIGGVIHNGDAQAIQAQTDFNAAYTDAAGRSTNACAIVDGELSHAQASCGGVTNGPTYVPGLYRSASPIGVGAGFTITLDAQNNPDAVFIFQTDAALTTGSNSTVVLANGAQAKNVWWIAGSAATLGVSSVFKGTVIANGAAVQVLGGTASVPTLVEGRLLSHAAAVGVDAFATITVPH